MTGLSSPPPCGGQALTPDQPRPAPISDPTRSGSPVLKPVSRQLDQSVSSGIAGSRSLVSPRPAQPLASRLAITNPDQCGARRVELTYRGDQIRMIQFSEVQGHGRRD